MSTEASLPEEVLAALRAEVGAIASVDALGGLSGRTVAAVHGARGSLVVKGPAAAPEVAVATDLAAVLTDRGVRTPRTLVIETAASAAWLLMEYLPEPLPRERWGADERVVGVLRALHSVPVDLVAGVGGRYRPGWDAALTSAAVTALDGDAALTDRLSRLAARSAHLFEPVAVVSGDPNPLNWRVDSSGAPVLLDWERLTLAHPAVDLGILLPGLADGEGAAAVAAVYGDPDLSAEDLLLAKAWSVVELAATAEPGTDARELIESIRDAVLSWFERLPVAD